MDIYTTNKESLLDGAYQFFRAGYYTIKISKKQFQKQIMEAPEKYNIVELVYGVHSKDEVILQTKFGGWNDLKSIIRECTSILDKDVENITEFSRGQNIFQIDIVTARFHIIIRRNWVEQCDVIKITCRS